MTNYVPHGQTLVLKGLRNSMTRQEIQKIAKSMTPYLIDAHIVSDKFPAHPNYAKMAYLNYPTEAQAIQAKSAVAREIELLRAKGGPLDLSRVVVLSRAELHAQAYPPSHTLWIGNIHDATEADVLRVLRRFGPLVPRVIDTADAKRYAFANFANGPAAAAALLACSQGAVVLGPKGSTPVVARPRDGAFAPQPAVAQVPGPRRLGVQQPLETGGRGADPTGASGAARAAAAWECCICMSEAVIKAALVPCGHVFCPACCAELAREGSCPMCREPVEKAIELYGV